MTAEQKAKVPPIAHPIVRTHPETGRKAIFLGDHAQEIEGMDYDEGRALIEELKRWSEGGFDPLANIALVHAGLGQNDEAMRWLEKAYQAHSAWLIYLGLKVDLRWDALRSDARFQDLLRRVGFPA